MKTDAKAMPVETALANLKEAHKYYRETSGVEDEARRLNSSAREAFNQAQKDFDNAVADLKKHGSEWNTHWGEQQRKGQPAA